MQYRKGLALDSEENKTTSIGKRDDVAIKGFPEINTGRNTLRAFEPKADRVNAECYLSLPGGRNLNIRVRRDEEKKS